MYENFNSINNRFSNSVNRIGESASDLTNQFRNSINQQNPALQNLKNHYESKWISLQTPSIFFLIIKN